jgi:hypothetical protein
MELGLLHFTKNSNDLVDKILPMAWVECSELDSEQLDEFMELLHSIIFVDYKWVGTASQEVLLLDGFRFVPEIWRPVFENVVLLLKLLDIPQSFVLSKCLL